MIAFATAMGDPEAYRRFAQPGIRRAAEADSVVLAHAAVGSIGRSYNLLLDAACARCPDLEALVLVHEDVEISDPDLCAKVRDALADPAVGAAGCVGASGVHSIAWWEGQVSSAPIVHRYREHGGGDMSAFSWTNPLPAPMEVDTLDGFLLVLAPWAVHNLRFDESLQLGHGFDLDFCLRLRASGRKVMTADLRVIRHLPLKLIEELELWVEAHIQVADKWDGRMPGSTPPTQDWRMRARRSEAEREAARTLAYSNASKLEARVMELEESLAEVTGTVSWRLTEPLRRLNGRRARRRQERQDQSGVRDRAQTWTGRSVSLRSESQGR